MRPTAVNGIPRRQRSLMRLPGSASRDRIATLEAELERSRSRSTARCRRARRARCGARGGARPRAGPWSFPPRRRRPRPPPARRAPAPARADARRAARDARRLLRPAGARGGGTPRRGAGRVLERPPLRGPPRARRGTVPRLRRGVGLRARARRAPRRGRRSRCASSETGAPRSTWSWPESGRCSRTSRGSPTGSPPRRRRPIAWSSMSCRPGWGDVVADEERTYRRLSEEAGLPFLALDGSPAGGAVDRAAARLLPAELSRRLGAIAVHADDESVTVATSRAGDALVGRAVRALTGRRAEVVIAPPSRIARAQRHAFGAPLRTRARRTRRGRSSSRTRRRPPSRWRASSRFPTSARASEAAPDALAHALPQRLCRRHQVLPLALAEGTLAVAMAEPQDLEARSAVAAAAGRPLRILVASDPTVRSGTRLALLRARPRRRGPPAGAPAARPVGLLRPLLRPARRSLGRPRAPGGGARAGALATLTVLTAAAIAFYAISSIAPLRADLPRARIGLRAADRARGDRGAGGPAAARLHDPRARCARRAPWWPSCWRRSSGWTTPRPSST